ncbi:MAG: UvrD-helicase domain-containing protein, partial [Candidatus Competibacteraceae bacterium]|nr:UvrD-helicase domain-containing protein [Candidatus Competibacteraceae bacterium]
HKALGFKARFSIYDARDSLQLIQDLAPGDSDTSKMQAIQWQISRWKSARILPQQAASASEDELQQLAANVYADYTRQLQAYNAVDFDDLILLPLVLFDRHPDILET